MHAPSRTLLITAGTLVMLAGLAHADDLTQVARGSIRDTNNNGSGDVLDTGTFAGMIRKRTQDDDRAILVDETQQFAGALALFGHHRRAAVNETLQQPCVQGVGKAILDFSRQTLPMRRVVEPVRAVADIGPGADMGDTLGESVDIAADIVEMGNVPADPIRRQPRRVRCQMQIDPAQQADMDKIGRASCRERV